MWRFNGTFNSDGAVLLGHTFQMTANARFSTDSGKDVTKAATWESSISPSGLLTGLVAGILVLFAGPAVLGAFAASRRAGSPGRIEQS